MWNHLPEKINRLMGYRTTLSMKKIGTWSFIHDYCGY
ncbi:SdpI family protein [Streptococcus agalactiae]